MKTASVWVQVLIKKKELMEIFLQARKFNLTCKKSPPSIGGEMNCGFFCGFDALRKTIAL